MDSYCRDVTPLTRRQALSKLAVAPFGRVIFTQHAMPALEHVSHVVSRGQIVIRSHPGAAITTHAVTDHGTVVLYQADDINPATGAGWTVTATGLAHLITDPAQAAAYCDLLRPWAADERADIITISPGIVTGFQLSLAHDDHPGCRPAAGRGLPCASGARL